MSRAYWLVREGVIPLYQEDGITIQYIGEIIRKAQSRLRQDSAGWLNGEGRFNYDNADRRRLIAQIRNIAIQSIPCISIGNNTTRPKIGNPAVGIRILTVQDEWAWREYNRWKQRCAKVLVFKHQNATKLLLDQNLVSAEFIEDNQLRNNSYLNRRLNGV